ncbi:hypothetical protein, partial [Pontibacter silvestris]
MTASTAPLISAVNVAVTGGSSYTQYTGYLLHGPGAGVEEHLSRLGLFHGRLGKACWPASLSAPGLGRLQPRLGAL